LQKTRYNKVKILKWLLTSFLVIILLGSAFAAGQQGSGSGQTGSQNPTTTVQGQGGTGNQSPTTTVQNGNNEYGQGTGQGSQTQTEQRTQEMQQVQSMVQQRQQEMNQEMQGMSVGEQKTYQNQNQVRLAVHTLLAMENMTGGIGKNVSAIAREFNNSIQATIRAENSIQTRSGIARFFAGGDDTAATEIEQQINQNRVRIQQLTQNMNNCDCDEQVKAMLQEQIQNMEQEQTRLQQLAQKEKSSKGLLGWIWKR